jgi:hypothetical protein
MTRAVAFPLGQVAIERTETGLALCVYPRKEGELLDNPFITFQVDEAEVIALQNEIGLDAAPTTSQPTERA